MRLDCYQDARGFDLLEQEWNELLSRSSTNTVFLTCDWQRAWWRHFGEGKALQLLAMREGDGSLAAVVPIFTHDVRFDPGSALPYINVENALPVAGGEVHQVVHLVGGSEVSDYLDIIAPPEFTRRACVMLLDFLAQKQGWQALDLRSLPAASPTTRTLAELAESRGWSVQTGREDVCPVLVLPDTWDRYLTDRLDKKRRHELRRKMRKAERDTNMHWYWGDEHEPEQALQIFFELHRASDPEKDAFMSERMERFFRDVAEAARQRGWLRLAIMRFDGQAVASYLCFDYNGDRLVYNSGFDLSTYGALSPGIVLLGYVIEDTIRAGCRRLDFLQGDERYKYDLGATDTEVKRLFIRR